MCGAGVVQFYLKSYPGYNTQILAAVTAVAQAVLLLPQGYAVKAGMLCARGELLLMADADGATVAAEEQRLEEALQKVKVLFTLLMEDG